MLLALGVQPEGEHQQKHAKYEGVGADPQRQNHGSNERLDDKEKTEDDRGNAAKREPPTAMLEGTCSTSASMSAKCQKQTSGSASGRCRSPMKSEMPAQLNQ